MNRYNLVTNGLIDNFVLDEKGKGHKFVSKFIEAGLVHYQKYGDILITKETLDKFIGTMVGCPVIINHKQVTDDNVEKERVGVISNVWFNPSDGWYYCDGIIWNKQAIDLVKNQGWNVSCAYSFESDRKPLKYHGKTISMEFTNGNFQHLAIVETPRYEDANIVINSVEFDESKHPRDEQGKFTKLNKTQSDELGKALYTINKEAKKIRDFRNEIKDLLFYDIPISDTTIEKLNDIYKDDNIKFTEYGKPYLEGMYDERYESIEDVNRELESVEDEEEEKELEDLLWEFNFGTIAHINLHNLLSDEEYEKQALYNLKQDVLKKYNPEKIGMHRFNDDTVRELYKIGNFSFHSEDISEELNQEQIEALEKLEDISSENKLLESEQMDLDKAKEILKEYLSEDVYNCVFNGGAGSGDFDTVNNGFVTLDRVDETGKRQVIWIPENVHWVPSKEQSRVYKICKEHKNGDETKFNFEHTRVKPTKEQIEHLKNTLNDIKNKYKFKDIAQIEISSSLNRGSLGVCYAPQNASLISLSPQLYNGKYTQDKYEKGVKDGWNPKGTGDMIKSVLTHEIGHSITCNSNDNGFWTKIAKIKIDYMKNITNKDIENPDFISNYARTNKYEFVAEAFCQGTLSKKYGKYTNQVMNAIKEHFGKTYQTKLALNALEETQGEMWVEGFGFGYPIDELEYNKFREEFDKLQKTEQNQEVKNSIETKRKENLVMTALNDLENFVKNIVSNACEKDKEKEVMNEDKRKLIDEVGGILKGKVDDEIIRTIIGKLEKIAYEPSEDDKAVNKCKNEDEKDKKEFIKEKEIATGKKDTVENAMDKVRKAIYSSSQVDSSSVYMTREERIEQGNEY